MTTVSSGLPLRMSPEAWAYVDDCRRDEHETWSDVIQEIVLRDKAHQLAQPSSTLTDEASTVCCSETRTAPENC
jgi:hypothetical protein